MNMKSKVLSVILAGLLLVIGFQNCAKSDFSPLGGIGGDDVDSDNTGTGNDDVGEEPTNQPAPAFRKVLVTTPVQISKNEIWNFTVKADAENLRISYSYPSKVNPPHDHDITECMSENLNQLIAHAKAHGICVRNGQVDSTTPRTCPQVAPNIEAKAEFTLITDLIQFSDAPGCAQEWFESCDGSNEELSTIISGFATRLPHCLTQ